MRSVSAENASWDGKGSKNTVQKTCFLSDLSGDRLVSQMTGRSEDLTQEARTVTQPTTVPVSLLGFSFCLEVFHMDFKFGQMNKGPMLLPWVYIGSDWGQGHYKKE